MRADRATLRPPRPLPPRPHPADAHAGTGGSCKWLAAVAVLVLLWGLSGDRPAANGDRDWAYTVVVDAGSTGSRVHVFRFSRRGDGGLALEEDVFRQQKPGLSSYADDPRAAAASLKPLLDAAVATVPEALRGVTAIQVRATAGLRFLEGTASEDILSQVELFLGTYPFVVPEKGVTIMDGMDEGAYMWLTMNYLLGNVGRGFGDTVGSIDLGGGSVQQAYAVSDEAAAAAPPGYVQEMRLGDVTYNVYVHSYLGYGLMAARAGILGLAPTSNGKASNCVAGGFAGTYTYNGQSYGVQPDAAGADAAGCVADAALTLQREPPALAPEDCPSDRPCAFVAAWDGGGGPGAERVLLTSYFFDRAVEAGLATEGASEVALAPRDFLAKASEACAADSVEALEAGGKAEHAPYFCMDLAFIYALLTEGFGVNAGAGVQAYKKFLYNGREFESAWPLGAALVTVVD